MKKVCIILVNWNRWRDTIECLESVLKLDYPSYITIVCDNASEDHSLDQIAAWAEGKVVAECRNPALRHLTAPSQKPIPYARIELPDCISLEQHTERLVLINTGENFGFAAANNTGLRLGLLAGRFDYAWLLNNDTVVDTNALTAMVDRMGERPDAGICGSTLFDYDAPRNLQTLAGCQYNSWTARVKQIGTASDFCSIAEREQVEHRMAYVAGASMLVSRKFVETIGLMEERYFLYFEEIDWAVRAKGKFALVYAPKSMVYHKGACSTGASAAIGSSPLIDYYATRNRILFTLRFAKIAIPSVLFAIGLSMLRRVFLGRFDNVLALMLATVDAFRHPAGVPGGGDQFLPSR